MADEATGYQPNEWQWWKDKLAGKEPKAFPDVPMQGFYRYKPGKSKTFVPVRIWYTTSNILTGVIGSKRDGDGRLPRATPDDILGVWSWCLGNPVTKAAYDGVVDRGEPWPDEIIIERENGTVESSQQDMRGHNSGDSDFTSLSDDVAEWRQRAAKIKKSGVPKNSDEADVASDVMTKLRDFIRESKAKKLEETKPLRDQVDEINVRWQRVIDKADDGVKDIAPLVAAYIEAEKLKREAEAAKMQEEAKASGSEVKVEAVKVKTGTRRAVSTVNRRVVEIDDLKKVAEFIASLEMPPADFVNACRIAAERLLKASVSVPGARLETKTGVRGS